jgi:hypothetical protein
MNFIILFFIYEIDKSMTDYSYFDWSLITDVLEFLIPHMAPSNVTYLAGQLFWEN